MRKVLIHFTLGLGDAVQLTVVLQHLQKYRPDWELYLQTSRGKHPIGRGYCQHIWHDQEPGPDHAAFHQVFNLLWLECYTAYAEHPSTKACNCLREVFGIRPVPELCRYQFQVDLEDLDVTALYLESIGCRRKEDGRYNAAIVHYQGNTSSWRKNFSNEQAAALCETIRDCGYVPVILDWDQRSPLPDDRLIYRPEVHRGDIWGGFGSGDAARIKALIEQSSLAVMIDSGPGKCAAATTTPTLTVWTHHHPIQFHDLDRGNVLHLVPEGHLTMPLAREQPAGRYFVENYRFRTYDRNTLTEVLCQEATTILCGEGFSESRKVSVPNAEHIAMQSALCPADETRRVQND